LTIFSSIIKVSAMISAIQSNNKKQQAVKLKIASKTDLLAVDKSTTSDSLFQIQVERIICNNLSDPTFGVEELAGKLFMSRSTLHRKLRHQSDITASDLITVLRLKRAKELLKTNLSLLDIAYEIGLSSHSYFNKKFARQFDQKPRDYRNRDCK